MLSTGTAVRTWFAGFDPRRSKLAELLRSRRPVRHAVDGRGRSSRSTSWQALGLDRSSVGAIPGFATRPGATTPPCPVRPSSARWRSDPAVAREVRTRPPGAARGLRGSAGTSGRSRPPDRTRPQPAVIPFCDDLEPAASRVDAHLSPIYAGHRRTDRPRGGPSRDDPVPRRLGRRRRGRRPPRWRRRGRPRRVPALRSVDPRRLGALPPLRPVPEPRGSPVGRHPWWVVLGTVVCLAMVVYWILHP